MEKLWECATWWTGRLPFKKNPKFLLAPDKTEISRGWKWDSRLRKQKPPALSTFYVTTQSGQKTLLKGIWSARLTGCCSRLPLWSGSAGSVQAGLRKTIAKYWFGGLKNKTFATAMEMWVCAGSQGGKWMCLCRNIMNMSMWNTIPNYATAKDDGALFNNKRHFYIFS